MKGEKMKTILLTGANGGLGNAIAKRLLQENHRVILIYHQNIENIQELTKEYPNQTYSFKVDITNEEEVKNVDESQAKYLIPYIAWNLFATILSLTIFLIN